MCGIPAAAGPAPAGERETPPRYLNLSYNLTMPVVFTLAVTKLAAAVSRLFGRGSGNALPGLIAERLDPNLAAKLVGQLPQGVILVTGTNGKTTTTKLIATALTDSGERVLTNKSGSNLRRGIFSALIDQASLTGRINATIALFEIDEAALRLVASELNPTHIVVLNLFRDQLDRYGELDTTAAMIGEGIAATTASLHLNADDPLVASLAKYAKSPEQVNYFGIEGLPASAAGNMRGVADSDRCPNCRQRLKFSRTFYAHIGHYKCPNGDFARPQPEVTITSVDEVTSAGSAYTVAVHGKRFSARLPLPGTYNLYNALAAIALGQGLGLHIPALLDVLAKTEAAYGRVEQIELNGRRLYLLLIKNPAGFGQVLETFLVGQRSPLVLMVVNDNIADGRDVSWLWDVPLESLQPANPMVVTAGERGTDMALRLKYAGIEPVVATSIEAGIDTLLAAIPEGGTGYILPTYTAMIAVRQLLASRTSIEKVGV